MNKIIDIITNFITSLKTDKKKLILVIAVLAVLIILIFPKGNKKNTDGFTGELEKITQSEFFTGKGSVTICNKNFDVHLGKAGDNYQIGCSNEDINYEQLITKCNNNLYFNYGLFESRGGIANVKCKAPSEDAKEKPITLFGIILDSLNSENFNFKNEENYTEAKLSGENWKTYWEEIAKTLKENRENILQNYTDAGIMGREIDVLIADAEKLANSSATDNYMTLAITTEKDEGYILTVDTSIDFNSLPSFINANSFDANRFTIVATINISITENTVNTPAGYVYSFTGDDNINNFVTSCWNSVFGRKAYTPLNEVTVKADSVTNIIYLGDTTETYQYTFNKDGIKEGVLIVSSYDKEIIKKYMSNYDKDNYKEDEIIFDRTSGKYYHSFTLSDTARDSISKIATTANGLADFLKTAEGVIPIV